MVKKPLSDPPGCTSDILSIQDTLEILGGKWKMLLLHYLITRERENNTFKKMEKDMDGISAKMLSKELKSLEENKLVSREVMPTKPITVQYAITDYGKEVRELIQAMVAWGQKHRMILFNEKDI